MNAERPTFGREFSPDDRQVMGVFVASAFAHAIALYLLLGVPAPIEQPTPIHLPAQESPVVIPVAYFDVDEPPAEPEPEAAEAAEAAPAAAEETVVVAEPEPREVVPPVAEPLEAPVEPVEPVEAPVEVAAVAPEVVTPEVVETPTPEVETIPVVTSAAADAPPAVPEVQAVAPPVDAPSGAQPQTANQVALADPGARSTAPNGSGAGGNGTNTAPSQGDGDIDGLRDRYHRQLSRRLSRLQNSYSPSLQRLMLEGTVVVSIILDEEGRIVDVVLAHSSGDPRLDDHAVDQVRRMRRLVSPPPELGLAARTVELPISYAIQS